MHESSFERDAVVEQLQRLLASTVFRRAERSSALLRYLVEETLNGRADRLKEYTLGAEGLGRGDTFDPRSDPVVRAEASRLRARLDQYYETLGQNDPIRITLTKGSYVPQFLPAAPAITAQPASDLPSTAGATSSTLARSRVVAFISSPALAWMCTALAGIIAVITWLQPRADWQEPQPPALFEVELKSDGVLASDVGTTVVLSPDGTRIVFVSRGADGRTHLNLRRLNRPETIPLPGTEGARAPFMSFDGRWAGFWADGKLKKIALDGGAPVVLCDATDLLGASWGEDDSIIAALGVPGQLSRVPAAGGEPVVAFDLTGESTIVRWPQLLPRAESVIYTAMTGAGADRANIEVQSVRGGSRKILVQGATFGRYFHSGYLTYVNQGTLYAVRFDPSSLTVSGPPIPLLDEVAYSPLFGYAQMDSSRSGMVIYRKGTESQQSVIASIDRTGNVTPIVSTPGRYGWLRLSPDGERLALTAHDSGIPAISIYNMRTAESTRVTTQPGEYTGLTWLPGGSLVFGGASGLGLVQSDQTGQPVALSAAHIAQTPWSISTDAQRLAYYERSTDTGFDLWTVPIRRTGTHVTLGEPEPFLATKSFEVYPTFSPDGRWMAYASNESGAWEIYVRRFPSDGSKVRVSAAGGVVPRWSPTKRELLYRTAAQHVMVAPYQIAGGSLTFGTSQPWSAQTLTDTGVFPNFDISASGDEIITLLPATDPQTANHVTVLLNFGEEIRRRTEAR
jgi:serine/threonine-protein kinase